MRAVECVQVCLQEWRRLTKFEFLPSLNDDAIYIWLPLENNTFKNDIDSIISSSLRKLKDFISNNKC